MGASEWAARIYTGPANRSMPRCRSCGCSLLGRVAASSVCVSAERLPVRTTLLLFAFVLAFFVVVAGVFSFPPRIPRNASGNLPVGHARPIQRRRRKRSRYYNGCGSRPASRERPFRGRWLWSRRRIPVDTGSSRVSQSPMCLP